MLKSLYWKLTLAFMLVAFITAALVAVFIRLGSADRLRQLIVEQQRGSLEQALQDYYTANGSWAGVDASWREIQFQAFPRPEASSNGTPTQDYRPPGGEVRANFMGLADAAGKVLVPVETNYPAGSQLPQDVLNKGYPLLVEGKPVGTILIAQGPSGLRPEENLFLQRTNHALVYASLGALLVALLLGILLSGTLTRPLKALTQAAHSITQGQLEQQVKASSNDEIGQLATAFNRMSQEVARVNRLRRQMTADIAHDLRTPLTVISGYIESMRDGVLKPTPQRLALIYSEIERLQDLVGDLRMLSLADAGELSLDPQPIPPQLLLEQAAALFRHQAEQRQVTIEASSQADLPELKVDEARMMQVLGNLITNALRYTPAGGKITLSAHCAGEQIEICVQDTGEGIAAEDLPDIFNRFHRSDKSRHSEEGESGLGLAIVKALVELHGGSTAAESTPGQGTSIHLYFPSEPAEA